MVGHVSGALLDHTHADVTEGLSAPSVGAIFTIVIDLLDGGPVDCAEWDVCHFRVLVSHLRVQPRADSFADHRYR